MGPISKIGKDLIVALTNRDWSNVEQLLPLYAPDKSNLEEIAGVLLAACQFGHVGTVEKVVEMKLNPMIFSETYNHTLNKAVNSGYTEIVKLLLPVYDPAADNSFALASAARSGNTKIVELLLPVSDPKENNSLALQWAAQEGYEDIVKILLPQSDPKTNDSLALKWAAEYYDDSTNIIKMLIPVSDYYGVSESLSHDEFASERLKKCIEDYEVFSVKERLEEAVQEAVQENDFTQPSFKRKM